MSCRKSKSRGYNAPTPSFGNIVRCIPSSPVQTMRTAPWNPTTLKQVVAALQMRRITQSMDVADFYQAVKLIPVVDDMAHDPQLNLKKGERILLDLLCATSPTFYKWGDKEGTLEVVNVPGKRLAELQEKLKKPHMLLCKYNECLAQVLNCRGNTSTKAQMPTIETVKLHKEEASALPQVRADMSLEERVQVRASAREQREQKKVELDSTVDRFALLRLADALWSYSRHILLRQTQIQAVSPARKGSTASKACVMTLKDIVNNFAGSLAPSQVSKSNLIKVEKATKKQVVDAIRELHQLAPDWIFFSDHELTKSTTVWIKQIEYQTVRSKLGAPNTSPAPLHSPVTVQRSLSTDKPLVTQSDQPLKTTMPPRRLVSLDAGPAKRQRTELKTSPKHSPSPTLPLSPPRITCKSLRINPNLILTGADYCGGMIIQPSDETPRGLKRLFTQLNAGRRI